MNLLNLVPLIILVSIALIASWTDVRSRLLPNWLAGLTFVSGLACAVWVSEGMEDWLPHLLHAIIALMIGFALYGFKVWGAGDGKFYSAVAVWSGLSDALILIVSITSVGLILAVVGIARNWGSLFSKKLSSIPYGVAIGFGAVLNQAREYLL